MKKYDFAQTQIFVQKSGEIKMVKFGEKFGLPKDRKIIEEGLTNISIFKIEITKSKKKYDQKIETEQGTKLTKELIDIAYVDAHPFTMEKGKVVIDKETLLKFYSSGSVIVEECKDIVKAFGKADGNLSQTVEIDRIASKISEGSKNPYLYFADNESSDTSE